MANIAQSIRPTGTRLTARIHVKSPTGSLLIRSKSWGRMSSVLDTALRLGSAFAGVRGCAGFSDLGLDGAGGRTDGMKVAFLSALLNQTPTEFRLISSESPLNQTKFNRFPFEIAICGHSGY